MEQVIERLATALALGTALLVGLAGAMQELSPLVLALRSVVAAVVVFGFVRVGGDLIGKSLLRGLAEHELKRAERQAPRPAPPAREEQRPTKKAA